MARRRSIFDKPVVAAVGAAALVSAALLGVRSLGLLERLELAVLDHHVRMAHDGPPTDPRVSVVEVSEADIQALGTWPIPDGTMARLIETITNAGARVVGIDIYRDLPVAPGSDELDATLGRIQTVIFPSKFADGTTDGVPPPAALAGTSQIGFNNTLRDRDGVMRRGLLFMEDLDGEVGPSFAQLAALFYLFREQIYGYPDPDDPDVLRIGEGAFRMLTGSFGSYVDADSGGHQFLMDYRGAPQAFEMLTLTELLAGEFDPELFRDRIVFVGVTADSTPDLLHLSIGTDIPGVVGHAHLASQLVRYAKGEGSAVQTLTDRQEALLVVACAVFGAVAGLWTRSLWRFAFYGAAVLTALWAGGWALLVAGWWTPVLPSAAACVLTGSTLTVYLASREKAERTELMQLFSRHVTKQVAEQIWMDRDEYMEGGRPRPKRQVASVLFVDMKGYTSRAEKMDPADLMEWLNDYLRAISQNVLDAGGMVEDYFGDGMMACFGIPIAAQDPEGIRRDAESAVLCCLEIEKSVRRLNAKWAEDGFPRIGCRAGICTGIVVVGSIGSEDRLKYGPVGDVVVTAQRLESLSDENHDFDASPCRVLISTQTHEYVKNGVRSREFGEVLLKGKSEPVLVHEVLGRAEGASKLESRS